MAWLPGRCAGLIPAHLSSLVPCELPRLGLLLEEKGAAQWTGGPWQSEDHLAHTSARAASPTARSGLAALLSPANSGGGRATKSPSEREIRH